MQLNNKRAIFGWGMYDWANSAYVTSIMAVFFPIFFNQFWSIDTDTTINTARLGMANSIAGIFIAMVAPILGAIADKGTSKRKFLFFFTYLGIVMSSSLYLVAKGSWQIAIILYILATIGFSGGNIFYDSLITGIASEEKIDFVSSLGYSLGYLGGGILLSLNVWMTLSPKTFGFTSIDEAVRWSFLSVSIWWALFSVPLFLFVKEPASEKEKPTVGMIKSGFIQLKETFQQVRHMKTIFLFLISYWLYIDGVDTIIRMAVDYGISIGLKSNNIVLALLITQFIGFPSSIAFGYLGGRIGTKRAIFIAIIVYLFVTIWGAFINSKIEFYILSSIIGLVQGGIQALSRSFYAKIIPVDKSAEFFGFYNMIGKFAVVIGPVLMGGVGLLVRSMGYSGDIATRVSITSISLLFIIGGTLFYFVNEDRAIDEIKNLS
ncbi:MAG: MFS transporter [Spirochaetota bacterium]|nr:MFS transporter [Spirochaetota bacterium]